MTHMSLLQLCVKEKYADNKGSIKTQPKGKPLISYKTQDRLVFFRKGKSMHEHFSSSVQPKHQVRWGGGKEDSQTK